jgi:hypothetical protein
MAESSASKGLFGRWRESRRRRRERRGDSPERLAEHHTPKRDWADMAVRAAPGGQRHSTLDGDHR